MRPNPTEPWTAYAARMRGSASSVARHLAELADRLLQADTPEERAKHEGNIVAICDALDQLDAVALEHPELRARGDACADWVRQHLD